MIGEEKSLAQEESIGPRRWEAVYNPGTWPYAKRCINAATVTTEEGSRYCGIHEGWDA